MLKINDEVSLNVKADVVDNSKAMIVINHGFAEYVGRYDWVARELNKAGYSCVRYDLRGHGSTKGPSGHIDSYKEFISDCEAVVDYAQGLEPDKDLYMLGHSMGGLVSVMSALSFPQKIKGQVLSGPALRDLPAVKGIKGPFLSVVSTLFPKMMINNPVENDICSVPEVVEAYKKDPLVIKKASAQFLRQFTLESPKFVEEHIHEYNLPVILLHGEKDIIVPPSVGDYFLGNIKSTDKTHIIYEGLYHEILNARERDQVMADIVKWLDEHTSQSL